MSSALSVLLVKKRATYARDNITAGSSWDPAEHLIEFSSDSRIDQLTEEMRGEAVGASLRSDED